MKTIHIDFRELIRRALILLAASALCALVLIVMFTDVGVHMLFRAGVYLNLEEVDTGDTAHLEYYDAKALLNDTDSYRIFLDESKAGSYDAALDFLKFIKQNTDVNAVCLSTSAIGVLNEYLTSGDAAILSENGITGPRAAFVQKLYLYNQTLPPQKKVSIVNTPDGTRCFIVAWGSYDRSAASEGIFDVSVIYPGKEDCDPLFDVDSLNLEETRIRFGTVGRLSGYVRILEGVSGNLGRPAFTGLGQPDCFFLIEPAEGGAA
ncbi:MAG: hypothetical protein E7632_01610 [Ruminococcaceae bacterium]|nr:hypothetical protein [Oscillospiraceae bacterium]